MRNILAVAGKEIRAYFHSPIAYLVMAVYAVLCGFFFYSFTATYVVQTFRMQAMGGMGMPNMTINDYVIRPLFEGVLTIVLLLYVLDWVTAYSNGPVSSVLSYMSLTTHFDAFAKGVVDLKDLVYYLSVIVLGIFLTSRSVEALKGRV